MAMTARRVLVLAALALVTTRPLPDALAVPIPACTAGEVIAAHPNCPASGSTACLISTDLDIGDGCVLDLGTRTVTVAAESALSSALAS